MEQLNLLEAKKHRDRGIKVAVDHAEQHHPDWKEQALEYLKQYPGSTFMTEQVRAWAYLHGLPKPPSGRAWGAVITEAKKQGIIKHIGYGTTTNPRAHGTPASLWAKEGE